MYALVSRASYHGQIN